MRLVRAFADVADRPDRARHNYVLQTRGTLPHAAIFSNIRRGSWVQRQASGTEVAVRTRVVSRGQPRVAQRRCGGVRGGGLTSPEMRGFTNRPGSVSEQQLAHAPAEPTVGLELVDGTIADELADAVVIAAPASAPGAVGVGAAESVRGGGVDRRPTRVDEHPPAVLFDLPRLRRLTGSRASSAAPPIVGDLDTTRSPPTHGRRRSRDGGRSNSRSNGTGVRGRAPLYASIRSTAKL
jgi:hypothetical protein